MTQATTMTSMESLLKETGAGTELDLTGTSSTPYDETLDSPIIGQQYLAKFHPLANYETQYEERESSVVSGVHFNTPREMQTYLDDGYEKISVDMQNGLVNGKIRDIKTKELVDRPPVIIPLEDKKSSLLSRIDNYTEKTITSGFEFNVTSGTITGPAMFDSTKEDQMTFSTMYAASQSPNFENTPPYNGFIPMRGRKITKDLNKTTVVDTEKQIYQLDQNNMQFFSDALALHIGKCKQIGWSLQNKVNEADEGTWDKVSAEIEALINPVLNPDPIK